MKTKKRKAKQKPQRMTREDEDRMKLDFVKNFLTPQRVAPAKKLSRRRLPTDRSTRGTVDYCKGYRSIGLSVHPSQVKEFRERARQHGLTGIKYENNGDCIIQSRAHRAELLKITGIVDRDGGYGD